MFKNNIKKPKQMELSKSLDDIQENIQKKDFEMEFFDFEKHCNFTEKMKTKQNIKQLKNEEKLRMNQNPDVILTTKSDDEKNEILIKPGISLPIIGDKLQIAKKNSTSTHKSENKEKVINKQKLKFTTCETVLCIFFPFALSRTLKRKYELFKKASNYLLKYINIFYLIKMLESVEKMQSILMNSQQITLFNYISKPRITLHETDQKRILFGYFGKDPFYFKGWK